MQSGFRFVPAAWAFALITLNISAADPPAFEALLPNEALKIPFQDDVPIQFLARAQNAAQWDQLTSFWNESTQDTINPLTGEKVTRKVVIIKVPLGLNAGPQIPAENPLTVAKWELGKKLYYDKILSSNGMVACATCHDPAKGFTDQKRTSLGINQSVGPINAPTVINSAYNVLQFWDGRAHSLEDQSQGPVTNPKEMFAGPGDPWEGAIKRIRSNPEYVKAFERVFGHGPTRDAAAKAIASYERSVLSGNSLHDRADLHMRKRVAEEETGRYELKAEDYVAVIKSAFEARDTNALSAIGANDPSQADALGKRVVNGRNLFFNKARCTSCHVGDNFTDNSFHNLGVGAKDGELGASELGRYQQLPTGHKDPTLVGAFKTPGLRALLSTAPYMHSGEEKTLEEVVELYDRGGNVNPFLDAKMRDLDAEMAYRKARAEGKPVDPGVKTFGPDQRPIIPLKLNLTVEEKADLVLFMKALQGDPIDPIVADPERFVTK